MVDIKFEISMFVAKWRLIRPEFTQYALFCIIVKLMGRKRSWLDHIKKACFNRYLTYNVRFHMLAKPCLLQIRQSIYHIIILLCIDSWQWVSYSDSVFQTWDFSSLSSFQLSFLIILTSTWAGPIPQFQPRITLFLINASTITHPINCLLMVISYKSPSIFHRSRSETSPSRATLECTWLRRRASVR